MPQQQLCRLTQQSWTSRLSSVSHLRSIAGFALCLRRLVTADIHVLRGFRFLFRYTTILQTFSQSTEQAGRRACRRLASAAVCTTTRSSTSFLRLTASMRSSTVLCVTSLRFHWLC